MAVQGLWNVGGVNLPDFGISEKLGIGPRNSAVTAPNWKPSVTDVPVKTQVQDYVKQTGNTVGYTQGPYGGIKVNSINSQSTSSPTPSSSSGGGGGGNPSPSDAQFDAVGVARGDIGGYERVMAEQRAEAQRREGAVRGAIDSGFNSIFGRLDQMANLFPQQQAEDEGFVQDKFNAIQSGIDTAKQGTYDKLALATEGIKRTSREKTSQVAEDLRNMMKATTMQVGAMGGGSSSATDVMLPYAFGKQAAKAGAQIARGTISNLSDIEQKKVDVQTTYDTQVANLNQWLTDARMSIREKYRQALQDINMQKNYADERKMQALTSLETGLLNQAQQELSGLESEQRQFQRGIQEWALNRYAQLQDMQLELQNTGNFNPRQMTYDALQGITGTAGRGGASNMVNLGVRYRDDEEMM